MPPSDQLVARYRRQLAVYRNRTSALLVAAWDRLPGYDEADIDTFTERTAAPLEAAKRATVNLSAGFFALALRIRAAGVDPDDVDTTPDLRGPFAAMWHAFTMGRPYEEALRVGRSTASATGFDFVQRTSRRTGDTVAAASGQTVRWQRRTGPKACDWCRQVAPGNYRTAESADFGHERDDCVVVPA